MTAPAAPDLARVLQRLHAYARRTGVRWRRSGRVRGWEALGLPDLRGFAPQLRSVALFDEDEPEFPRAAAVERGALALDELETRELWLLHDLAHLVWYDVASVTFGHERWRERDFFLEQHLVSEAFAVLLLDYHVLSCTRHHGLAVDLEATEWALLRRRVRGLPALDSFELCRELVGHYLGGAAPLFTRRLAAKGDDVARLARWRDHEVSYAEKQRWYVFLWWDDLNGLPLSQRQAVVEDSTIAELVWLGLRLFTVDPDAAFDAHVERVARQLGTVENLNVFGELPKYTALHPSPRTAPNGRAEPRRWDFRFTDVHALAPRELRALVEDAEEPSAERLFLFWQLLGTTSPDALAPEEQAAVATLAASAQTATPDPVAWAQTRRVVRRLLDAVSWTPQAVLRSAFFLP